VGTVLADADKAMTLHGWKRFVGVVDSGKTVLIYLPAGAEKAKPSRICLAVCDQRELVIVAAEIDADALAKFVCREIGRRQLAAL
jgi:sigma54-dependent transcription regulator